MPAEAVVGLQLLLDGRLRPGLREPLDLVDEALLDRVRAPAFPAGLRT